MLISTYGLQPKEGHNGFVIVVFKYIKFSSRPFENFEDYFCSLEDNRPSTYNVSVQDVAFLIKSHGKLNNSD